MLIHRDAWSVGSLSSPDPNAHSFNSPNWRHSGEKRPSPQDLIAVEDDAVTIGSHPPYSQRNLSVNIRLINAISFSQTQDGFLKKVQESLQRMSELSVMAQGGGRTEAERILDKAEFAQLQNRIKEIESKMFKAASCFESVRPECNLGIDGNLPDGVESATALSSLPLNQSLDETLDSDRITIESAKSASVAADVIHHAMDAVADLRVRVGCDLQRLNCTGERLFRLDEVASPANPQIQDVNVAEESTRFARFDILKESGTAMLAQANALPQSALRLLG